MKKVLAAIFLLTVAHSALRGQDVATRVRSATSLPTICQQGTATQAAELISVNGALYLCSGPSTWKLFAHAPKPTDAIQFASPNGKDNNDGLSWGSAKLTIMAAYDALPSTGGVIYFTAGVAATSTGGQGIWICGSGDKACYVSPPAGWRKQKSSVTFQGVGSSAPIVNIGGSADNNHPAVWLSGTNSNMVFSNFAYQYPAAGIRLGCNSSGNCADGTGGVSGVTFDRITGHIQQNQTNGPNVFIGSNTFWIWFNNCGFQGNSGAQVGIASVSRNSNITAVTTSSPFKLAANQHIGLQQVSDPTFNGSYTIGTVIDSRHFSIPNTGPNVPTTFLGGTVIADYQIPIVVDPGSGFGSGLIFINGLNNGNFFSMGGVRLWDGLGGGGIYVNGITVEGDFSHVVAPPVWISATTNPTNVRAQNIELADAIGTTPVVEVDNASSSQAKFAVLSGIAGTAVGPVTWLDGYLDPSNQDISPLRYGQQGFFSGRAEARSDVGRGMFPPVAAQAVNLANTNPSSWTSFNGGSVTTGIKAPDGTTGAGQFSGGSGTPGGLVPVFRGPSIAVGVVYIFGVWVRSQTANGYASNTPANLATNYLTGGANRCNNSSLPNISIQQRYKGDGQWDYVSGVCKITTADSSIGLSLQVYSDGSHTIEAYAPVVLGFAPGAISDNEAYELSNNLANIPTNCTVGSVCMMPGQELSISGSTQFMGSFTHANTTNRTYTFPNLTGTAEVIVGSGSTSLNTGLLSAAGCEATISVAAKGVSTSTRIQWNFASDPSAVAGYGSAPIDAIHVYAWPTADNVNFRQCSAVSVKPGAINILWNAYN